eukprot:scaffold1789_cov200-Skeletonema_marinoi.AAC.5
MERDSFRDSNLVVSVACAIEVTDVEEDEEVEGDWGEMLASKVLLRVCSSSSILPTIPTYNTQEDDVIPSP